MLEGRRSRDEHNQNTLHEILKEIKYYILKVSAIK